MRYKAGVELVWSFWIICKAKNIVCGRLILLGKKNQKVCGNIPVALFISEILRLSNMEDSGYLSLSKIVVLSQFPDSFVITHTYRLLKSNWIS